MLNQRHGSRMKDSSFIEESSLPAKQMAPHTGSSSGGSSDGRSSPTPPNNNNYYASMNVNVTDLEIALENERGLRLKAEEVAALVAARARASVTEKENELAAMKKELQQESTLRIKAEEISALVAARAQGNMDKLENDVAALKATLGEEKRKSASWASERERLVLTIRDKDLALGGIEGELGSVRETSAKEVNSLWSVVNKLESLDEEKEAALREMQIERDQTREELKRFISESSETRKECAEWKRKAESYKGDAAKIKVEATRFRKELRDIDKQLIEAVKNEGIDLFGGGGSEPSALGSEFGKDQIMEPRKAAGEENKDPGA